MKQLRISEPNTIHIMLSKSSMHRFTGMKFVSLMWKCGSRLGVFGSMHITGKVSDLCQGTLYNINAEIPLILLTTLVCIYVRWWYLFSTGNSTLFSCYLGQLWTWQRRVCSGCRDSSDALYTFLTYLLLHTQKYIVRIFPSLYRNHR